MASPAAGYPAPEGMGSISFLPPGKEIALFFSPLPSKGHALPTVAAL